MSEYVIYIIISFVVITVCAIYQCDVNDDIMYRNDDVNVSVIVDDIVEEFSDDGNGDTS
jgi:hypothetical protein